MYHLVCGSGGRFELNLVARREGEGVLVRQGLCEREEVWNVNQTTPIQIECPI